MDQFRAPQAKTNKKIQQGQEARSAKVVEVQACIDALKVSSLIAM
jgi:hypothetical protein